MRDRGSWAIWFAALAGFVFDLCCFYPGAMGYDDAVTWARVLGAPTDDVGGVGLLMLWRVTENFISGPGGPYLVELLLFWTSLPLVLSSLRLTVLGSWTVMLVASSAPICFLALSRMGTDTALMAALLGAFAALLLFEQRRRSSFLFVTAVLLIWSLTLRRNALPAVIPLVIYGVWLQSPATGGKLLVSIKSILAMLAIWSVAQVAFHTVDQRKAVFPATQLWDLAMMSVDVGEVLLPPNTHGPGLDVEDIRQAVDPYTNTTLFSRTHAGMKSPFLSPESPLNAEILNAWGGAIVRYPSAYLAHRWQLTKGLFGTRPRSWPHDLVYVDDVPQVLTNPPVDRNHGKLHLASIRAFEALRDTFAFCAWPYLLLLMCAIVTAWLARKHDRRYSYASLAIGVSGLLYALPLPFVAPSAEIRYLTWPCFAAIVSAAFSGRFIFLANSRTEQN